MKETLIKLKELQNLDTDFLRIQRSIKAGPVEEQNAQAKLTELQEALAKKEQEVTQEKMAVDEHNLEFKTIEDEILKLKEKMNTVKNNKEYTIVKEAMTSVNNRKEQVENVVLEHMETLEGLSADLEKISEETKAAEESLAKIKADVAEQVKQLKEEAAVLRDKRKICADGVDAETLEDYEKTLRAYKGLAVVPLINGACQGCYRNVAQNIAVKVRMSTELTRCRGCDRFLYDPESLEN